MDIGIGLPTTVPDKTGPSLVDWARRAERRGFTSLAVLDRLVYDSYEPLIALAAAAAVTERIKLATTILIAAYRDSAAVLAKQLASIDHISGGRLVLGVAAGGRADDFIAAGTSYADRGERLDDMLVELREIFAGRGTELGIGPEPPKGGPPVLVGGHSKAAMRRSARIGQGWIAGGSSASSYAALVAKVRAEWRREGRTEDPHMVSLAYVSLGADGRERAERYLAAYYAFIGDKARRVADGMPTTPAQLREFVTAFQEAGCDELILLPCTAEPGQVDLIADAVLS